MMADSRRGFTLIEMIVVLIIVAVLAWLTAPAMMRMMAPHAEEGDATPLTALLRGARRASIERGVVVALTLDPVGARYRADSIGARGVGLLGEGEIIMQDGVSLETDSARVRFTFRPDGSVFGDSVMVRGQYGSAVVSVDRWTGAIRIDAR